MAGAEEQVIHKLGLQRWLFGWPTESDAPATSHSRRH